MNKTASRAPIHSVKAELGTKESECLPQSLEIRSRQVRVAAVFVGRTQSESPRNNPEFKLEIKVANF